MVRLRKFCNWLMAKWRYLTAPIPEDVLEKMWNDEEPRPM